MFSEVWALPKRSSADTAVKYRAYARYEVKRATHARRRFTCQRHASRTIGVLIMPQAHLVAPIKKDR